MTEKKQAASWLGPIMPAEKEARAVPSGEKVDWDHLLQQAKTADRPLSAEELSLWKRGVIDGNARMWNVEYVDACQAALEQRDSSRLLAMLDAEVPAPAFLLPIIAAVIRRQSTGTGGRPPSLTELAKKNISEVYTKLLALHVDGKDPHAATVAYLAKIKGVSEKTIERALKKPQR